jgi:hypothetical protein
MKQTHDSYHSLRQSLLDDLASITTMRPGTLAEEYRQHPSPDGKSTIRLGPYYKHQIWQDGRNITRRVPAAEAALLKEDIEEARRYHRITGQLAELNIRNTIAMRAARPASDPAAVEKKTSRANASPKNTAKQSISSDKRAKGSRGGKARRT